MCNCIDIGMGTYANSIAVINPHSPTGKVVNVDHCISTEVRMLWNVGVRTTGCCCGHNKQEGYIGVIDKDIPRMKAMGYKVAPNSCRPNDEDSFYPKYSNRILK